MSFAHGARRVKPASPQIQALRGATFSPHSPPDGPARVLWDLLNMLVTLLVKGTDATPDAQIVALRMANGFLLSGWRVWSTMEDEARYASAGSTGWQGIELEAAREDLCRVGEALRQRERQLVGDPPPLARPAPLTHRTTAVRPRKAGRPAAAKGRAA